MLTARGINRDLHLDEEVLYQVIENWGLQKTRLKTTPNLTHGLNLRAAAAPYGKRQEDAKPRDGHVGQCEGGRGRCKQPPAVITEKRFHGVFECIPSCERVAKQKKEYHAEETQTCFLFFHAREHSTVTHSTDETLEFSSRRLMFYSRTINLFWGVVEDRCCCGRKLTFP